MIESRKNRSNVFEILPLVNCILAFLIVMHHSFNLNIDYNSQTRNVAWVVERYFYNLSECSVPVFFFLSAYLFYRNYDGTYNAYKTKVKRRVSSLLIPYIIFNVFGYFKHIILKANVNFSVVALIKSIIISDTMPLWFIRELFILVLLAPVIYYMKKHVKLSVCIGIICTVFIALGIIIYRSFLYWLPIYIIGACFDQSKICRIEEYINERRLMSISIILLFLISPWFLPNTTSKMGIGGNCAFIIYRYYCVLFWVYCIGCLIKRPLKTREFMHYSFWVYCVHFPLISLTSMIWSKLILNTQPCILIIQFFITVFMVFSVSIISGMILKKALPHMWKILNGGR